MTDSNDDLFGPDDDESLDEFDRLSQLLFEQVSKFADEEDVPGDLLPMLLVQLAVNMRMMDYATSVAKPSAGGLKLDLDRFRQDVEHLIRDTKKGADSFIAEAKEALAAAEQEEDESKLDAPG